MSKQNLAVIFGGQSSEHEISCMSASNIIQCIDAQRYNIILVGITKEGHWVEAADLNAVQDGSWRQSKTSIVLSPDATINYTLTEDVVEGGTITGQKEYTITSKATYNNPVIFSNVKEDIEGHRIGYLVYSGFEAGFDQELFNVFKDLDKNIY